MVVTLAPGAYAPPTHVDPVPAEPRPFGLFSAATVLDDTGNPKVVNGTEWEPYTCDPAQIYIPDCVTPPAVLTARRDGGVGLASPFYAQGTYRCAPVGRPLPEWEDRARQALIDGEERSVEGQFWTGVGGTVGHLADPGNEHLGTALSVIAGISALEGWLGLNYGGVGVIHIPRALAPVLFFLQQLDVSGDRLFTKLGTRVAAGGGYDNSDPDGDPGAAGTMWAYATGPVRIWRGAISLAPTPAELGLDRSTNEVKLVAQRPYVVGFDCGTADANMTVDGCGC